MYPAMEYEILLGLLGTMWEPGRRWDNGNETQNQGVVKLTNGLKKYLIFHISLLSLFSLFLSSNVIDFCEIADMKARNG